MVRKNTDKSKQTTKGKRKGRVEITKQTQKQKQIVVVNIGKTTKAKKTEPKKPTNQTIPQPSVFQPVIRYSTMTQPIYQPTSEPIKGVEAKPVVGVPKQETEFYKTSKRPYESSKIFEKEDFFEYNRDVSKSIPEPLFAQSKPIFAENVRPFGSVPAESKPAESKPKKKQAEKPLFASSNISKEPASKAESIKKFFKPFEPTETTAFTSPPQSFTFTPPTQSTTFIPPTETTNNPIYESEPEPFLEERTFTKEKAPRKPKSIVMEELNQRYLDAFGFPYTGGPLKITEFRTLIENKELQNLEK